MIYTFSKFPDICCQIFNYNNDDGGGSDYDDMNIVLTMCQTLF